MGRTLTLIGPLIFSYQTRPIFCIDVVFFYIYIYSAIDGIIVVVVAGSHGGTSKLSHTLLVFSLVVVVFLLYMFIYNFYPISICHSSYGEAFKILTP